MFDLAGKAQVNADIFNYLIIVIIDKDVDVNVLSHIIILSLICY